MIILNEIVEHIKFGSGVITELNGPKILVKFQDDIGTKMFLYPEAFESFLKAVNLKVENYVLEELHIKQKQEQIELERKEEEREAAELEEKMAEISNVKKKTASRSTKKKS